MSEPKRHHPFTFKLVPSTRGAAGYHRAIRKHGRLVQRSDTPLPTKGGARNQALAMIDRLRIGQLNW